MRSILLSIAAALAGLMVLWSGTDGFHAFTTEGARRYAIEQSPRSLPDVQLMDQDGRTFKLSDMKGKHVLMTFMYTRCGDVCPQLEMDFQAVYKGLSKHLGQDIVMLSVSFDPQRDDILSLKHHAGHYGADGERWRMVTVPDLAELSSLLDTSEVTVIPNLYGGFEHNAAFYLVNPHSQLIRIFDTNAPDFVIRSLNALLEA
jgi:protein SCO1